MLNVAAKCLFQITKTIFSDRNTNFDRQPLKTENGQFHTYCIIIYVWRNLSESDFG